MKVFIKNSISNITRVVVALTLFSCLSFTFKFLAGIQQEKRDTIFSNKKERTINTSRKGLTISESKQVFKERYTNINFQSKITEIESLKSELATLKVQQEHLEEENSSLRKERDSALSVIENSNEYYGILKSTIKKASKVWISDIKLSFLKELGNGKFKSTLKAKNTDVIQVGFTVNGSKISLATDKNYYIQVVDSKNNIVGKKERKDFGSMTIEYSDLLTVMYIDKDIDVKADIQTYDLKKGVYRVYIFDEKELVMKSSFELE